MDNISTELILVIVTIGVVLADFAYRAFRNLKPESIREFVVENVPQNFQGVALWCTERAYDAVEQVADAYEDMTSDEKIKEGTLYFQALYKLLTTGKSSKKAARGLLESMIYADKKAKTEETIK